MRPLVSVVTPTWQRHELIYAMQEHLKQQDYPSIQHVIVSDGPDRELYSWVGEEAEDVYELGRNWSGLMPESFGIAPLLAGYLMARGDYIMNWSDDDRALTQSHISRLVDLLESTGADFVYPRVRIWRNGNPAGPETKTIGTDPPQHSQITHMLFRASCLHRFGMPRWGTHPVDWSLVSDWMKVGATWAMLDDVTFSHRLDQI